MEEFYKPDDPKTYWNDEELARAYKAIRKPIDPFLVRQIIESLKPKFDAAECIAVDVGCGSGQATIPLSDYFLSVTGVDPSAAQIAEAIKDPYPSNVNFTTGSAESLPIRDLSVQLVHARSALHWFDIPKFFLEVDRILVPGGVLAISGGERYVLDGVGNVDSLFQEYMEKYKRGAPGTKRLELAKNLYEDIEMPYPCIKHLLDKSTEEHVSSVMDFLVTKFDFAQFRRTFPNEARKDLAAMRSRIMELIGKPNRDPASILMPASCRTFVIICKKPE